MSNFRTQIAVHRDTVNRLHQRIHSTYRTRAHSDSHKQKWSEACKEFHKFRSEIDEILQRANTETIVGDQQIREFVFDFLVVDPIYFRSGYEKERLLRFVKPLNLTDKEKTILRQVIQRRIKNAALREFRRYCQMIPKIQTDEFLAELLASAQSNDQDIKRRATFALQYVIPQ